MEDNYNDAMYRASEFLGTIIESFGYERFPYEICYQAQLVAEVTLKNLLISNNEPPRLTHDIWVLLKQAEERDILSPSESLFVDATYLTNFETAGRYASSDHIDSNAAKRATEQCLRIVGYIDELGFETAYDELERLGAVYDKDHDEASTPTVHEVVSQITERPGLQTPDKVAHRAEDVRNR